MNFEKVICDTAHSMSVQHQHIEGTKTFFNAASQAVHFWTAVNYWSYNLAG